MAYAPLGALLFNMSIDCIIFLLKRSNVLNFADDNTLYALIIQLEIDLDFWKLAEGRKHYIGWKPILFSEILPKYMYDQTQISRLAHFIIFEQAKLLYI